MFEQLFPILSTPDLPRALAFYGDLLGFAQTYRFPADGEPDYVGLRLGQSELGIGGDPEAGANPDPDEPGGQPTRQPDSRFALCVYADDCDAAVERLRDHGVRILSEPVDQPWGERMAEVADPDGNRVIILSRL